MTEDIQHYLAKELISTGALKINTRAPFRWTSGALMPVYADNRLLLGNYKTRRKIAEAFSSILKEQQIQVEAVAGTATAGIPHATSLADILQCPLLYVRSKAKGHGVGRQIEGVLTPGSAVVVVEDLLSTGGSVLAAVDALRKEGSLVNVCLSIFTYGFPQCWEALDSAGCQSLSLLTMESLLGILRETHSISEADFEALNLWYKSPFTWARTQAGPVARE